jgi:hypothetical protein
MKEVVMNADEKVMKAINEKYGIEVKYWAEPGNDGYYYISEDKKHSEFSLDGEVTYSEHGFHLMD